VMNLTW